MNYGSGASCSSGHVCAEFFASRAGIEIAHVPYKGDSPAMTDLLCGQIQLMFTAPNVAMAQHKAGKTKIIAVTSRERMAALPDVPSVHETLRDFENLGWIILFAHASTPAPVLDALAAFWTNARNNPGLKAKADGMGMYAPAQYNREAVGAFLRQEGGTVACFHTPLPLR